MTAADLTGRRRYRPGRASVFAVLTIAVVLLVRGLVFPPADPDKAAPVAAADNETQQDHKTPPDVRTDDRVGNEPIVIRTAPAATPDPEKEPRETAPEEPASTVVADREKLPAAAGPDIAAEPGNDGPTPDAPAESAEVPDQPAAAPGGETAVYRGAAKEGMDLAGLKIVGADSVAGLDSLVARGVVVLEIITANGVFIGEKPSDARRPVQTVSLVRQSAWGGGLSPLQLKLDRFLVASTRETVATEMALSLGIDKVTEVNLVFTPEAYAAIHAAADSAVAKMRSLHAQVTAAELTLRGCFTGSPLRFAIETIRMGSTASETGISPQCRQVTP